MKILPAIRAKLAEDLPTRAKVYMLEKAMLEQPQVKLEVHHHFGPGIYMRELLVPKGVMTTGKVHKFPHWGILLKGERSMLMGDHIERVKAPYMVLAPAGTKRVCYAHEDSIWMTVHPNPANIRDIDELERLYTADSEADYLTFVEQERQLVSIVAAALEDLQPCHSS